MKTPFPFYSLENTTRFPKKPTAWFFKFCINSLWKYSNSQLWSFGLAQLCPSLLHKIFLMFTQLSLQSKQSAQLCNMTRVATRSCWWWPQPVLAWVIQPRHNSQLCTWLHSGDVEFFTNESPNLSWSTITRAVTEESNGQHSDGVKQKGSDYRNDKQFVQHLKMYNNSYSLYF